MDEPLDEMAKPDDDQGISSLWGLELANGDRCLAHGEGTQRYVGSRPVAYLCDKGDVINVDAADATWSAEYFEHGNAASTRVDLRTAWF